MTTPELLLDELDSDVESMRRRGFVGEADRMAKVAADFRAAMEPIALVSEHTAMMRSGKTKRWLRDRFDAWHRLAAAEMRDGERWYRLCVLPSRLAIEQGAADAESVLRATG